MKVSQLEEALMEKYTCQRKQTLLAAVALGLAILAAWLSVTLLLAPSPDSFDPASIATIEVAQPAGLK
jgi:hypothetical protein